MYGACVRSDPLDLDWSALSHAYGPATDLPDLLRALRSPQEQRRAQAAEQFRTRALHQGSRYPATAAAVPYLIGLLADDGAPDRTLGHELLVEILPEQELNRLSGRRPHRLGPRLHELAEQRSDRFLARQQEWLRHGTYHRPEIDPAQRQAYEAVHAGVPTFLRLLDHADRDARGLSAHLLSFFPEAAPQVTPALTARLAAEPDPVVGSFLCLAAGMIGDPRDAELVAAVTRRRDQQDRISRWTVLMGLVRLTETPDADMLEQLCDCLFHGPKELHGWAFQNEDPAPHAGQSPPRGSEKRHTIAGLRGGSGGHRLVGVNLGNAFPLSLCLTTDQVGSVRQMLDLVLHPHLGRLPSRPLQARRGTWEPGWAGRREPRIAA